MFRGGLLAELPLSASETLLGPISRDRTSQLWPVCGVVLVIELRAFGLCLNALAERRRRAVASKALLALAHREVPFGD